MKNCNALYSNLLLVNDISCFFSALKELSELEIEGLPLQVESAMETRVRGGSSRGVGGGGGGNGNGQGRSRSGPGSQTLSFGGGNGGNGGGPQRQPDFPLR